MDVLTPDDIDFRKYMEETDAAEKVRKASDYEDDIMRVLSPDPDAPVFPKLPFANAWLYFAPGELTLWAGFNNSGKSMVQGQVLAEYAQQGHKVCIASFEMKPPKTVARMIRQDANQKTPTRDQVARFLKRTENNLYLYDQQGTVKPDRVIAVIRHCAEKLGVTHFAVDSLMKCVKGTEDYSGQKDFVDILTACARDLHIHIHLVAHMKKDGGDEKLPTRYDISGSAAISDLADNAIIVWRNKKKERDMERGLPVDNNDPDSVLIVDKARNGEWEGRVKLWFDRDTLRFSDHNRFAKRGLAAVL